MPLLLWKNVKIMKIKFVDKIYITEVTLQDALSNQTFKSALYWNFKFT